jgi:hypothetical protein
MQLASKSILVTCAALDAGLKCPDVWGPNLSVIERSNLSRGLLDTAPTDSENKSKSVSMGTFMGGDHL